MDSPSADKSISSNQASGTSKTDAPGETDQNFKKDSRTKLPVTLRENPIPSESSSSYKYSVVASAKSVSSNSSDEYRKTEKDVASRTTISSGSLSFDKGKKTGDDYQNDSVRKYPNVESRKTVPAGTSSSGKHGETRKDVASGKAISSDNLSSDKHTKSGDDYQNDPVKKYSDVVSGKPVPSDTSFSDKHGKTDKDVVSGKPVSTDSLSPDEHRKTVDDYQNDSAKEYSNAAIEKSVPPDSSFGDKYGKTDRDDASGNPVSSDSLYSDKHQKTSDDHQNDPLRKYSDVESGKSVPHGTSFSDKHGKTDKVAWKAVPSDTSSFDKYQKTHNSNHNVSGNRSSDAASRTVEFFLHVESSKIDKVFISFNSSQQWLQLLPIPDISSGSLWRQFYVFNMDPIPVALWYRYGIVVKENVSSLPLIGRFLGEDSSFVEETEKRRTVSQTNFDTFHFPQDRNYNSITTAKAVQFYTDWLLLFVKEESISKTLNDVNALQFTTLNFKAVKQMIIWILEKARRPSTSDIQRLYLCVIMGHLGSNYSGSYLDLPIPKGSETEIDRLLSGLDACAHLDISSCSSCRLLEKIASILVAQSSCPGWLSLAAHFYSYLGVNFLLRERQTARTYDKTEHLSLVKMLFRRVIIKSDQQLHQQLLEKILQTAPDQAAVVQIFENENVIRFFDSENNKDTFFIKFYQSNDRQSATCGEKLMNVVGIPGKLRSQMTRHTISILLQFAKSVVEPKKEHIDAFTKLILSNGFSTEEVYSVLKEVSKAKHLYHLIPVLLDNENFKHIWDDVSLERKVFISIWWIKSKLANESQLGESRTTAVYQGIDKLMSCSLNSFEKCLAEKLCKNASDMLLQGEDAANILKAFKKIEKLSFVVQEYYNGYVKSILKREPRLVRNSSKIFKQYSQSSLGQNLLKYVLDVIHIPSSKTNLNQEDIFRKMLEWRDIWITLLRAGDNFESNKKFKTGKEIWKDLQSCITKANISLDFLQDISQQQEEISLIFAILHVKSKLSDTEIWRDKFLKQISALREIKQECEKNFLILDSVITHINKISEGVHPIHDISEIISAFNERSNSWSTKTLQELNDPEFWGPLSCLVDSSHSIKPLMESVSFSNVAKTCFQEYCSTNCEDNEHFPTDLASLMELLITKGIERLQAQWNPVFSNPSSLTLETLKTLLGGVKGQEKLKTELAILEEYFSRRFHRDVKTYIKDFVNYESVLRQVNHLVRVLDTFGIKDLANETISTITTFVTLFEDTTQITLGILHKSMSTVRNFISLYTAEETDYVVEELGRSSELLWFVKEIVDEDIRFLIDAVEEYSDQFVSESLVSNLIDVHGFLGPLIKKCQQQIDPQIFIMALCRSCEAHKGMAVKIHQCSTNVNSLRGLYTNVANRGEITKEIIANCLTKGVYTVSLDISGVCDATMKYEYEKSEKNQPTDSATYSLPELHDLRSRAHLIVTSDRSTQEIVYGDEQEKLQGIDFTDFIEQINILTDIVALLLQLRSSGYVKYRERHWKKLKGTKDLRLKKDGLSHDLEAWEESLSDARQKYYFLNYYRSDQLCTLYDFLTNRRQVRIKEVLSLVHFVDPKLKKEDLQEYQQNQHDGKKQPADNPHEMVSIIGNALEKMFANATPVIRKTLDNKDFTSEMSKWNAAVKSGELFVASLEKDSPLTANVMLTLYENTSNAFPEPYQVVFCGPQTTWEEIYLALQRCFGQNQHMKRVSLFCIANVELLENEVQFDLVKMIQEKQNICAEAGSSDNGEYRLALICRGGDHHHIVEEFAQYSHHISGMSDLALSTRLKSRWPEVKMFSSALPGLGKTENIQKEVLEKKMNAVTFSISGPIDHQKLIKRLKQLNVRHYHCLHFDIGEVIDPLWLDTFLFQLIVTGMVSSETQFYHLQTAHVYMEIANTLEDSLLQSLIISKYFTRVHIKWRKYKDLIVSSEVTSNLQVVCQYFDVFDRAALESTEIHFTGPHKCIPIPAQRCRELLSKHYSSDPDVTFTALNTFLGVLADQLLKFSKSAFFRIVNLKHMLDVKAHGVRTNLFRALLKVSKEFASRSITTCHSGNLQSLSQKESAQALDIEASSFNMSAKGMVKRVEGMIQWEDSNHLVVVFHGANSQAISAVYRDMIRVPKNVAELLKSQVVKRKKRELEDFKIMSQEQLQAKLEKIACTKPSGEPQSHLFSSYALTPDNILKMILIILRVRANAPVIIMGETGCGKTSLVRYLANTCNIKFCTFNFHAGISEDSIKEFVEVKEKEAIEGNEQIWVFLDEINTCDHLGIINDVMCHHTMLGRPLSENLVFLAACNPYKLRPKEYIKTAGLEGKNIVDEYSKLVYRVHPLPEAMVDYVWDYGSLAPDDEKTYIERMVRELAEISRNEHNVLVTLLAESQKFIRKAEKNHFCVSLRDVNRCILLVKWFAEMIETRKSVKNGVIFRKSHLQKHCLISEQYDQKPFVKSIVLALAHCYQSRLPTADLRQKYRTCMLNSFSEAGLKMRNDGKIDDFLAIVRIEEEDYLDRMELPPGTARNAALRENVFVMLVSILNRIPVFVVGKPGCSKSLSIQLIRSNLRGRDSKDSLFRKLPQLYVVSYQGSESSTSEGIIKVFEKASKYKSHNKDVLPVVLLDEVGLAENSKYNPLKVLHNLLEPGEGKLPEVAVVGISNWALDAAKMNRAIHLSRPEPTLEDLYDTGHSLLHADVTDQTDLFDAISDNQLRCLAEAYDEYQSRQRYPNFHGLRDYYSLIKSLSHSENSDLGLINIALQRNFGGIPGEVSNIQKIFLNKLKNHMLSKGEGIIPVSELIQKNLNDPLARHLMLITSGDSAIGILKQNLTQFRREIITIFGSRFEEDLSEDYNYRILSRIILCMERDCILILRDLERIYGSLYDMLNQNYAIVGKRKNCRVALGAYSNPMCHVNDAFRCIVLTDHHKVDHSDPPFLNRFEKQLLRFSDVLNDKQQKIIVKLDNWVKQMSSVQGYESQFKKASMFVGFHEDTLPSLVLLHSQDPKSLSEKIIERCKDDLMWIATPDSVLRSEKCLFSKVDSEEVNKLVNEYFEKPLHYGLEPFVKTLISENLDYTFSPTDEVGSKTIIMTYSNVHTDIPKCLSDTIQCQTVRLGAYKSEKQLTETINFFWTISKKELLILQCKPELDGAHMLLARSIIEDKRNSYEKYCKENGVIQQRKHVCIVVHLQRVTAKNIDPWQFSFLCGWKQVFLDVLEAPSVSLNEIRSKSIPNLLMSSIWPLRSIAQNDLLWCFSCIKYAKNQRTLESILTIGKTLFSSEAVYKVIEQHVLNWVTNNGLNECENVLTEPWQFKVACNTEALINSSTLYSAMEQHVFRLVSQPLAKIIYFLEKENAWPPHVINSLEEGNHDTAYNEEIWCNLMLNKHFFNISNIPEPLGAESYILDSTSLNLTLPFSQVIFRKIDAVKELVLEDCELIKEEERNFENGRLKPDIYSQQIKRYTEPILKVVPEIRDFPACSYNCYMNDVFDIISADFRTTMSRRQRGSIVQSAFLSYVKQSGHTKITHIGFYVRLHLFVWISKELILDQLRLVDCCQQFIPSQILQRMTDEYLSSQGEPKAFSDRASDDNDGSKIVMKKKHVEIQEIFHDDFMEKESKPVQLEEIACTPEETQNGLKESDDLESQHDEEQEGFDDVLVIFLCEQMLPSQEVVDNRCGGLVSWIRNASLLLSIAFKISNQSPVFHFLRLCVDFAKIVLVPSTEQAPWYFLYKLHEISCNLKPDYLDAEGSFINITENLIEPLKNEAENEAVKYEALQKFSSVLYGRCLDTNVDTSAAHIIVEQVLSLKQSKLVLMMCPVILRLLRIEERDSPGIYIDIITQKDKIENCPCLEKINDVFKDMFGKNLINYDSHPAVMICDLIQSLLNFEDRYNMDDLDGSDCELLQIVRKAIEVLHGNEPDNCGLILLSSVALLRAFFTMLSEFIAEKKHITKSNSEYSQVMNEISSLLTAEGSCQNMSLKIYFLKQLHQAGTSLFHLCELCRESDMLPAIKEVFIGNRNIPKAEFFSLCQSAEYRQAKAAYGNLTKGDEKDMLIFLNQCQNSTNHYFALTGILANMIYLKRAAGVLTDLDERLADWFCKKCELFSSAMKKFLLRIIGREEFVYPQMELSPESSVEQVQIALLTLHISCLLTSEENKNSPLKQLFTSPQKCKQSYLLAIGPERVQQTYQKRKFTNVPRIFPCSCGLRIAFKDDADHSCPSCGQNVDLDGTMAVKQISRSLPSFSKGYIPLAPATTVKNSPTNISHWVDCMEHMNPSVYRCLHLIVHVCLFAGVAMDVSSKDDLSSLLNIKSLGIKRQNDDPGEFCFSHVKADLNCLMAFLGCPQGIVIKVMHLVVERCTDLIRGSFSIKGMLSTPNERKDWEVQFTAMISDILSEALGSANLVKHMTRINRQEEASMTVEDLILEIDDYPADRTLHDKELKRLFRLTRQPSFQDFYSTFLNTTKDFQDKHSFLSLFFTKIHELSKIRHLFHLLKWTRLVSSALTHRISRKEAESKSINDFITGHLGQERNGDDEIRSLKSLFDSFKEAWNEIRPFVNQEQNQMEDEMPRLRETDCIGYCLIESDLGVYLSTAIRMLVALQNSILDEIILLSIQKQHPALGFLEKDDNCNGISSVSIQYAKDKDIISFQWSDELFEYAQSNLEYGRGEEVIYDFERIEIELANNVAFAKSHLTGSLSKFIFSKELFHSSGAMLTEIRKIFDQSLTLPDNVKQGLVRLKESRIKDAQVLLQHIEVLIFLLKLKLKNIDMEMTLKTFTEEWQTLLPSPFPVSLLPEPNSINLKHLAALYESLEDLLADGTIEGLPDQFRVDLEDEMKERLCALVDRSSGSIKLPSFLNALRRFVFRYLSSEKFLPDPATSFYASFKEPSLWPNSSPPNHDDFLDEVTLKYIHAVILQLEEIEKERKGKSRKLGGKYFQGAAQRVSRNTRGRTKRRSDNISRT